MTEFMCKACLVRGVEITTERDMWQQIKHYRFRSGMYYGRIRYAELRNEK